MKITRINVPFPAISINSWHGLPEITNGLNRKTLGVMYWSLMTQEELITARIKAKFRHDLVFK
jgi:hypothetical protein